MAELFALLPLAILLAILVCATWIDQRSHRIPNVVSLGGCLLGLLVGGSYAGFAGLGQAAAGLGIGFVTFIPFYILRAMGAGDVKLMSAAGSFLGPVTTIDAIAYTLVTGGVLALITVIRADGLRATASRYLFGLRHLPVLKTWVGVRQGPPPEARLKFPYALAISLGTLAALFAPPLLTRGLGP